MAAKRQSSKDDLPMQRVMQQKRIVDGMKHDTEVLRLDLTREARESRQATSTVATTDIAR
jgi:hypothetical protein